MEEYRERLPATIAESTEGGADCVAWARRLRDDPEVERYIDALVEQYCEDSTSGGAARRRDSSAVDDARGACTSPPSSRCVFFNLPLHCTRILLTI